MIGSDFRPIEGEIPLNILSPDKIFFIGDLVKIDFAEVLIQIVDIKEKKLKILLSMQVYYNHFMG